MTKTYVKIYKNLVELICIDRDTIAEIKETHDGITINLKDKVHTYITDIYMTQETKQKIVNADKFKNSNLEIDLSNPSNPVRILTI